MREIDAWLERSGLGEYVEIFAAHHIDFDVLHEIHEQDLKEFGIPFGDRKRLLRAIHERNKDVGDALDESHELAREGDDAERRQITVMFCDLVGSTAMSSEFTLEDYRDLLTSYQSETRRIVSGHDGYVARFFGDGMLAYFGYPRAREDDAERAVTAALAIVPTVSALCDPAGNTLACRIGIATGTVVIDEIIGASASNEKAALGITPNLAARLQSEAAHNQIIIAPSTLNLVRGRFETRVVGIRTLKGIAEETPIIEVLGTRDNTRFQAHTDGRFLPMIGRTAELELLQRRWQEAASGTGGACFIIGYAGLGKSRLAEHLITTIEGEHQVLRYSCSQQQQSTPLYPIAHELERTAKFAARDSAETRREKLDSLLSKVSPPSLLHIDLFRQLLSIDMQGDEVRHPEENFVAAIVAALLEHLSWSSQRCPTIVLFEDVHWIDPTTQLLIEQVVQRARDLQVLVLVTMRPETVEQISIAPHVSVLSLTPLTKDEGRQLVRGIFELESVDTDFTDAILARADGVPLFLEQLAHTAAENVGASNIPATLKDLLTARLDRLGAGKLVAQSAAVIGRHFTFALLLTVLDAESEQLEVRLANLERAQIISKRGFGPDAEFQFTHALLRDAAYDGLIRDRRHALHLRVALALSQQDEHAAERAPETIAYHFEAAAENGLAVQYWEQAGRRARQRSANLESATHFSHAIALLRHAPEPERSESELRLRVELGGQLVAVHGNAAVDVATNYESARALVSKVRDQRLAFRAQHGMRTYYMVRGQLEQARILGEELLRIATTLDDPSLLVQAHRSQGLCLFTMGQLRSARQNLEKSIDLYRPELHAVQRFEYTSEPLVLARCNLGWAYAFLGRAQDAVDHTSAAVRLAEELDHRHSLAFALSIEASTHQALEDKAATISTARRAFEFAQTNGYPYWIAWNRMLLAWAYEPVSTDMLANYELGIKEYKHTGARMMLAYFFTLHAELLIRNQHCEAALDALRRAEEQVELTRTAFYAAEIHRLRSIALGASGAKSEPVRASLRRAAGIASEQGNALLVSRIERTLQSEQNHAW